MKAIAWIIALMAAIILYCLFMALFLLIISKWLMRDTWDNYFNLLWPLCAIIALCLIAAASIKAYKNE